MTAAFSQQTIDEQPDLIRVSLRLMQKVALAEFAERGPAEEALVTEERIRRRRNLLAARAEKERLASR